MRLTESFACLLACAVAGGVSAQGAQAATQTTKLRSVSSPPSTALAPGAALSVNGQVTNRSRTRAKARVTLTLRTSKSAKATLLAAEPPDWMLQTTAGNLRLLVEAGRSAPWVTQIADALDPPA